MTKKELIDIMASYPDNAEIWLYDAEGGDYLPTKCVLFNKGHNLVALEPPRLIGDSLWHKLPCPVDPCAFDEQRKLCEESSKSI